MLTQKHILECSVYKEIWTKFRHTSKLRECDPVKALTENLTKPFDPYDQNPQVVLLQLVKEEKELADDLNKLLAKNREKK